MRKFLLIIVFICSFNFLLNAQTSIENLNNEFVFINTDTFSFKNEVLNLSNPYFISKYEVTQKIWNELFDSNPSHNSNCGDLCPVENINLYEICVFCNKLSEKQGLTPCYFTDNDYKIIYGKLESGNYKFTDTSYIFLNLQSNGYRLPTEIEWIYAAIGGKLSKGFKYSGSNDINQVGWYSKNTNYLTQKVGTKLPNELGLYDFSGNVIEWCWDISLKHEYNIKKNYKRIVRGGSVKFNSDICDLGIWFFLKDNYADFDIGFRLVRSK